MEDFVIAPGLSITPLILTPPSEVTALKFKFWFRNELDIFEASLGNGRRAVAELFITNTVRNGAGGAKQFKKTIDSAIKKRAWLVDVIVTTVTEPLSDEEIEKAKENLGLALLRMGDEDFGDDDMDSSVYYGMRRERLPEESPFHINEEDVACLILKVKESNLRKFSSSLQKMNGDTVDVNPGDWVVAKATEDQLDILACFADMGDAFNHARENLKVVRFTTPASFI